MNSKFLSKKDLMKIKFKNLGNNVLISKNVTIIGAKIFLWVLM